MPEHFEDLFVHNLDTSNFSYFYSPFSKCVDNRKIKEINKEYDNYIFELVKIYSNPMISTERISKELLSYLVNITPNEFENFYLYLEKNPERFGKSIYGISRVFTNINLLLRLQK